MKLTNRTLVAKSVSFYHIVREGDWQFSFDGNNHLPALKVRREKLTESGLIDLRTHRTQERYED
jgi:hypothetical protein